MYNARRRYEISANKRHNVNRRPVQIIDRRSSTDVNEAREE